MNGFGRVQITAQTCVMPVLLAALTLLMLLGGVGVPSLVVAADDGTVALRNIKQQFRCTAKTLSGFRQSAAAKPSLSADLQADNLWRLVTENGGAAVVSRPRHAPRAVPCGTVPARAPPVS